MRKLFLFYSITLLACSSLIAQESELKKIEELDAYIEQARKKFGIPGMAVGIVKDGKVVLQKGYGLKEAGSSEAVDEHTLFAIASITKAFTVTGLGMLEQEGKIVWNDRVQERLPYFQLHDRTVGNKMTIEDLTCHRSGLATFDGDLLWYGTNYSRKEIVERIRELPLKQTFRLDYGYQNIMFITAGQVVEEVSGQSWDLFLKERIFDPLGMKHTVSTTKDFNGSTNLAWPHLKGKKIDLLNYHNSGGTAALNSTVSDMCKWIRFWLNNGKVEGDTLLSAANIQRAFTPHTILPVGNFDAGNKTHFKSYGMGWFLMDYNGLKVAHHGGGLPGYISKIALVPEENLGMIILTNDMSSLPVALMYEIIDSYTVGNEKDWAEVFLGYRKKREEREQKREAERKAERVMGTSSSHELKDYTGTYTDKMYGSATVRLKDGKLWLVMDATKELFSGSLEHWNYDTFHVQFNDPFLPEGPVTFYFDPKGDVSGFKIDIPNYDFNFYNLDFQKMLVK